MSHPNKQTDKQKLLKLIDRLFNMEGTNHSGLLIINQIFSSHKAKKEIYIYYTQWDILEGQGGGR